MKAALPRAVALVRRLLGRSPPPLRLNRQGSPGTIDLVLVGREGTVALRGGGVEFALPEGAHVYLSSGGSGDFSVPPARSALDLEPEARYRVRVEVALDGGQAALWLIEYDERGRVAHQAQALRAGTVEWSWTTHPRHARCALALRLAGTGRLRLGGLGVEPCGAAARHQVEAAGPAGVLYRFTASADDPAEDLGVAVDQLEVMRRDGLIATVRIGAADAPVPPAIGAWLAGSGLPAVVEGAEAARSRWSARAEPPGAGAPAAGRFPELPRAPADLDEQGFVIVEPARLAAQEPERARQFWSGYEGRAWYRRTKPWAGMLRDLARELRPGSVLEFGCNVGRNLLALREADPGMRLVGIDINAEAVREGRESTGLDLRCGDETMLAAFADGEFDMVFTVSVLDHLAEPGPACASLLRCARRWACFLEVRLPVEGKVLRHFDHRLGRAADSTGASYSWHLERFIRGQPRVEALLERPCYLHAAALGPYYRWYQATLRG